MNERETITLAMNADRVPYKKFLAAVNAFYSMLDCVAQNYASESDPVRWTISVQEGSNLVHFYGSAKDEDIDVGEIIDASFSEIERLESSGDYTPGEYFNVNAIESAKKLARLAINGIGGVSIQRNGDVRRISARTIANADTVLDIKYSHYGSITGRLEVLSDRKGAKVLVYDELTGEGIKCYFTPEAWQHQRSTAITAFDDRMRVSVYGLIRYRPSGQPARIEVEEMAVIDNSDFDVLSLVGILS